MTDPTDDLCEALLQFYRARGGVDTWAQQEVDKLLAEDSPVAALLAQRDAAVKYTQIARASADDSYRRWSDERDRADAAEARATKLAADVRTMARQIETTSRELGEARGEAKGWRERAEAMREKLTRADYLIDRLQSCVAGSPVRDLMEAWASYQSIPIPNAQHGGSDGAR